MIINEAGLALIKHFEGFSQEIYLCAAGKRTIGYGHLLKNGEDFKGGITLNAAENLLLDDLRNAEMAVKRLISEKINDNQFSALMSFTFNLGSAALQRSSLRRKINSGYISEAGDEFLRWIFAGGKKYSGLYRRRYAEKLLFEMD